MKPSFSWIELTASLAGMALLAGILAPAVWPQPRAELEARARADMGRLARAFHTYFVDTGQWPSNDEAPEGVVIEELHGMPCLFTNVHALRGWSGPYLQPAHREDVGPRPGSLRDPWGRSFLLHVAEKREPGDSGAIHLLSRGPDGRLSSTSEELRAGAPAGDDLLYVVTRAL